MFIFNKVDDFLDFLLVIFFSFRSKNAKFTFNVSIKIPDLKPQQFQLSIQVFVNRQRKQMKQLFCWKNRQLLKFDQKKEI